MSTETETVARRLSRENAALRGLGDDCLKLAEAAIEGREALRKIGGDGLAKGLSSFDRLEATCVAIAESCNRITRLPLPLCLQDAPTVGEA